MAKKIKNANAETGLGLTDEKIKMHVDLLKSLWLELDKMRDMVKKVNGRYRGLLKSAKADGVDIDAMVDEFKETRQEPAVTVEYERNRLRYREFVRTALGFQASLFEDAAMGAGSDKDPDLEGYLAAKDQQPLTANPYPSETERYAEWRSGWTRFAKGGAQEKPGTGKAKGKGGKGKNVTNAAATRATKTKGLPKSVGLAEAKGHAAGLDGKSMSENPYTPGSPENLAWNTQWQAAQADLGKGITQLGNGATAH